MAEALYPIDVEVGARIRACREALSLSQHRLSRLVNISFRQIPKHKRDQDRIPVSRLMLVAGRRGTSSTVLRQGLLAMAQALDARKVG